MDDQALFERMRDKYEQYSSNGVQDCNNLALKQCEGNQALCGSSYTYKQPGDDLETRLCSACDSTGVLKENYHFRVLERPCPHCDGRGVTIYKNGQMVVHRPEAWPSAATETRGSTAEEGGKGEEGDGPRSALERSHEYQQRRRARLAAEVASLDRRLQEYGQEVTELESSLRGDMEEEEKSLRRQLQRQIQVVVGRLQEQRAKASGQLSRLDST